MNRKYRCKRCGLDSAVAIVYAKQEALHENLVNEAGNGALLLYESERRWDWEEELINRRCQACGNEWYDHQGKR